MDRGMGNREQFTPATWTCRWGPRKGTGNGISSASRQVSVPAKRQRQVFEGLVKNGVVHLIEGELPEGVLVKVVWE